jgi:S1-C subfamily serine protease
MDKWKKAVVHLECATDSEHIYDRIKRIELLRRDRDQGKITLEQFAEELGKRSRDLRYQGTAIFFAHNGRHYLLTARHVVYDEISAKREYQDKIVYIIFRVPSFDEVRRPDYQLVERSFLMNLGAGTPWDAPYAFSDPKLDLAIISLDQRDSRFADELINLGYTPVSVDDFADEPSKEGAEVYAIGFPGATSLLDELPQLPAEIPWSSRFFSLPTFSYGRVAMLHEDIYFFWVDMSIYPGNSGGPVIENEKLVGIVSAQAIIPLDGDEQLSTRIPFGRIIKAKYIRDLVSKQEQKDSWATKLKQSPTPPRLPPTL